VEGYAYSGGGREVIRVEVTLDDGISWHLVHDDDMSHPPNTPNAAGAWYSEKFQFLNFFENFNLTF
jgi:nitrate reductase (NAD(P)H)